MEQKEVIQMFKKLKFFTYFDRFDDIIGFSKILIVGMLILNFVLVSSIIYVVKQLQSRTEALVEQSKAVAAYLNQQELLNASTLATRIAADYFSMSYDNAERIGELLSDLFHPDTEDELRGQLHEIKYILVKGQLVQRIEEIDYAKVKVDRVQTRKGRSTLNIYRARIPVKYSVRKAGSDRKNYLNTTFVIYFAKSPPRLSNAYGLTIYKMGQISN